MKLPIIRFATGLITGSLLAFSLTVIYSPGTEPRDETLFVYGTLTNPIIRIYACWCLTDAVSANLEGYRKEGLNIVREKNEKVEGKLIRVSQNELARIDRYEDIPQNYKRIKISVDGELVWVYKK